MKKKLLYIINVDWYFHLHWLDRALAASSAGYDVHVLMTITEQEFVYELEAQGLTVHPMELSRRGINPLAEIASFLQIWRLLNQVKPDLVHTVTIKPNIYAGICCRFLSLSYVSTVPGLGTLFSDIDTRLWLRKLVFKLYIVGFGSDTNKVIFENSHDLKKFISLGIIKPEQGILIAGAGVDTETYKASVYPDGEQVNVLFAARLIREKGLEILVDAVSALKNSSNVELLVAGIIDNDSAGAISVEQLQKWQTEKKMVWLGQSDDMRDLIAGSHIVCLPTTYAEGIPRILIEAAAMERPVITSDVPGCNEFVRNHVDGLLVEPNNRASLEQALRTLIDNKDLRVQMGQKGRAKVLSSYNSDLVIRSTLNVYQQQAPI